MHTWQNVHFISELRIHGVEIEIFNILNYENSKIAGYQLIKYVKKNFRNFNLFFTCESDTIISNELLFEVSKYLPTALIAFDNLHAPHMHKSIAKYFDVVWLTSQETFSLFVKWGCNNLIFQPYAANPFFFQPAFKQEIENSVVFIGTPYGARLNVLFDLISDDIKCEIYTSLNSNLSHIKSHDYKNILPSLNKFKNFINLSTFTIGRKVILSAILNRINNLKQYEIKLLEKFINNSRVEFADLSNVYSKHSLCLNITDLRNTYILNHPVHKLHLRTFEIPMSGGLQFAPFTEELNSYFENGRESILYKSKDEMVDLAKFYINKSNSFEIRKMQKQARLKAETHHTWKNRFKNLLNNLNISNNLD